LAKETPAMKKLLLSILTLTAPLAYAQTTWHVDASRHNDTGDGNGWSSAKNTIQGAK